jgi:asparaginyl-tRNA synthetase
LTGYSLQIAGKWAASLNTEIQAEEFRAEQITIVGTTNAAYPLQKKAASNEFMRSIAHFRTRSRHGYCITKIRNVLMFTMHQYLQVKCYHCQLQSKFYL